MFNVQELATAVQYKIGLVTIIFNSNSFTNVKRQQQEWFGNRTIASDLVNPDFVKLAHMAKSPQMCLRLHPAPQQCQHSAVFWREVSRHGR